MNPFTLRLSTMTRTLCMMCYDVPCPLDQCMHHIEAQRAAREYDLAHSDELAAA